MSTKHKKGEKCGVRGKIFRRVWRYAHTILSFTHREKETMVQQKGTYKNDKVYGGWKDSGD